VVVIVVVVVVVRRGGTVAGGRRSIGHLNHVLAAIIIKRLRVS
jgi:hypothetical protein